MTKKNQVAKKKAPLITTVNSRFPLLIVKRLNIQAEARPPPTFSVTASSTPECPVVANIGRECLVVDSSGPECPVIDNNGPECPMNMRRVLRSHKTVSTDPIEIGGQLESQELESVHCRKKVKGKIVTGILKQMKDNIEVLNSGFSGHKTIGPQNRRISIRNLNKTNIKNKKKSEMSMEIVGVSSTLSTPYSNAGESTHKQFQPIKQKRLVKSTRSGIKTDKKKPFKNKVPISNKIQNIPPSLESDYTSDDFNSSQVNKGTKRRGQGICKRRNPGSLRRLKVYMEKVVKRDESPELPKNELKILKRRLFRSEHGSKISQVSTGSNSSHDIYDGILRNIFHNRNSQEGSTQSGPLRVNHGTNQTRNSSDSVVCITVSSSDSEMSEVGVRTRLEGLDDLSSERDIEGAQKVIVLE